MNKKFQNKYRIPSVRLQTWDYANNGAYFITICTKNREHFFGKIENKIMQLSEMGKLAEKFWLEIPKQFPFVELGNFVIMPNHVHGIIIINNIVETRFIASNISEKSFIASNISEKSFIASNISEKSFIVSNVSDKQYIASRIENNTVDNEKQLIQEKNGGITGDKNPMFHNNISRIVRWYKGRCSFEIRKLNLFFEWQSRFYDHIIQNSNSFEIIQNYIVENPLNWEKDKFYYFNPSSTTQ